MLTTSDISLIQPSRNNLKYLKWSYDSIRKNGGENVHICVADDYSNDGTWSWCEQIMAKDPNFHAIRNNGPKRLGHTILYDRLINEVATTPIVGIYHADMYLCPNALDSVLKHIKPLSVVSLTRIEPPLHPDGPEKVLLDCGVEPEEFDEDKLLENLKKFKVGTYYENKTTEGIFAPWFIFKEDFQSIGGHDPLYAPQSKEDSDIFNRFSLNGYRFIQTWDGFVYHMTCRGSRFNPTLTQVGKESDEWLKQNQRSTRNFIRKWGHFVKHDTLMKPIVPPKWDIGFKVENGNSTILSILEPWCSHIDIDVDDYTVDLYIQGEQENTAIDLKPRINKGRECDIIVEFNANKMSQYSFKLLTEFSTILEESDIEVGEFELDIFKFKVNKIKTYEHELIKLEV